MPERRSFSRDDQSLAPLVELSPLLEYDMHGRIRAIDRIDTPVDEHGIPRRVELMRQVLGTVAANHLWTGAYDVHHMAWIGSDYRAVRAGGERVGSVYRGSASLKVILPRQLHSYTHKITREPPMPPVDVMRQYALEHGQVGRLYDTIKLTSYAQLPALDALADEEKERLRQESYISKLQVMQNGELGIMPDIDYLVQLEVEQARRILRSIARVKGFSNSRHCQQRFFAAA